MPITLYDADGNPQEVPTAEEIDAQKAEISKKAEDAEKMVEDLTKQKEELEKDINPNWKEIRNVNKKLKDALISQGKEVDDQGNIIEKKEVNKDEILSEAKKMFQDETFATEKERLLASYSDEDKTTVDVYLNKLMAGEDKNIANLHKFFEQAVDFVFPEKENNIKRSAFSSNGHGPNINNTGKPAESAVKMGEAFGITHDDHEKLADPVIKF